MRYLPLDHWKKRRDRCRAHFTQLQAECISLDFSPRFALDAREKTGVLKADFDDANIEDRPVGVVMNLGDPMDDTGCCILKTGEGGERVEAPTTATGRWRMLEL